KFAISSQFAGAVATVEFLAYFDYFARKDHGSDYLTTHKSLIENCFQQVVYSINQPAAARGYQSAFWNLSLYDAQYFDAKFGISLYTTHIILMPCLPTLCFLMVKDHAGKRLNSYKRIF